MKDSVMGEDSKTRHHSDPPPPAPAGKAKPSRKERYKVFDEKYEFTAQDKAAYFTRLGLPGVTSAQ